MIHRHAPTHKFRRAYSQTVHIPRDLRNRQADPAGKKAIFAQGFGRGLPATIFTCQNGKLMRVGHAIAPFEQGHPFLFKSVCQGL